MKYPKRSQYKYTKSRYRIGNWPEYEAGLRRRGDLTVWLSEDAINSWREPPSGKPGGQRTYADIAIEAAQSKGEGGAVRMIIQPGRDAQLAPRPSPALEERNRNIRSIRELGRREWHTSSGYSKRSMVENTMYRYKTIIGRSMRSRTLDGQRVEVHLARNILGHDDPAGDAGQLQSGLIPARGTGDLFSFRSHAPAPIRLPGH